MLRKILFVIFVGMLPLAAADSIYTWGYGEQAHYVLRSVAMMTSGDGDYVLRLAAVLGLFVILIRSMKIDGKNSILQDILAFLVISTIAGGMFWISKKEYLVEDQNDGFTSPTVLVLPVGIGTTLSVFSHIEKGLGESMEMYFSTPSTIGYMNAGMGYQMSVHLGIDQAGPTDSNITATFNEYLNNCILPLIHTGAMGDDSLLKSDDLMTTLESKTTLLTTDYTVSPPQAKACGDVWVSLKTRLNADLPNMMADVVAFSSAGTAGSFATNASAAVQTLYKNAGNSAQGAILQAALKNLTNKGLQATALATGGDAANMAMAQALTETNLAAGWHNMGIATQKTLPLQKAVFTLVLMGIIVILALMSIIFVTMQYIRTIIMLFAVMVLWTPIAVILNYLISLQMDKYANAFTYALNAAYPTMEKSAAISKGAQEYLSFLGYFGSLIPMFAYLLVKGGDSLASSMFSQVASAGQIAARMGSGMQAQGNLQVNTASVGGRNLSNEVRGSRSIFATDDYGNSSYLATGAGGETVTTSHVGGTSVSKTGQGGIGSGSTLNHLNHGVVQGITMDDNGNITSAGNMTQAIGASAGQQNTNAINTEIASLTATSEASKQAILNSFIDTYSHANSQTEKAAVAQSFGLTSTQADELMKSRINEHTEGMAKVTSYLESHGFTWDAKTGTFTNMKAGLSVSATASGGLEVAGNGAKVAATAQIAGDTGASATNTRTTQTGSTSADKLEATLANVYKEGVSSVHKQSLSHDSNIRESEEKIIQSAKTSTNQKVKQNSEIYEKAATRVQQLKEAMTTISAIQASLSNNTLLPALTSFINDEFNKENDPEDLEKNNGLSKFNNRGSVSDKYKDFAIRKMGQMVEDLNHNKVNENFLKHIYKAQQGLQGISAETKTPQASFNPETLKQNVQQAIDTGANLSLPQNRDLSLTSGDHKTVGKWYNQAAKDFHAQHPNLGMIPKDHSAEDQFKNMQNFNMARQDDANKALNQSTVTQAGGTVVKSFTDNVPKVGDMVLQMGSGATQRFLDDYLSLGSDQKKN